MRFDIPLRFVPDVLLGETLRTVRDLESMGMEFDVYSIETWVSGVYIEAAIQEDRWPEIRDYIAVSPAVELDEETLGEWANEPDVRVIG